MKTTTIGWLANKNHATIIHSCKVIEQFLEIRDGMTINLMQEWIQVFNIMFSNSESKVLHFEENLNNLILTSGLSKTDVKNLLIQRADEIVL